MDSSKLRAELGWALQRQVVVSVCECKVPLHSRDGIWDSAPFSRMVCCSQAIVAVQLDPFCVEDSKTHLHRKPKEDCFMPRKDGGFFGGKGGFFGGCCVSMEVCKEERGGDDETPVFEVLSLNEK